MLTTPFSLVSPPLFMAADFKAIEQQWAKAHPHDPLMEKSRRGGGSARQGHLRVNQVHQS